MAQRTGVTQVLVFGSMYQGALLVPFFEPQTEWTYLCGHVGVVVFAYYIDGCSHKAWFLS